MPNLSTETQRGILEQLIRYALQKRSRDRIAVGRTVTLDLADCVRALITEPMQEILDQYDIEFSNDSP